MCFLLLQSVTVYPPVVSSGKPLMPCEVSLNLFCFGSTCILIVITAVRVCMDIGKKVGTSHSRSIGGTLSLTQSINQSILQMLYVTCFCFCVLDVFLFFLHVHIICCLLHNNWVWSIHFHSCTLHMQCRERGVSYSGRIMIRCGWKVNGVIQMPFERYIGQVPIMVKVLILFLYYGCDEVWIRFRRRSNLERFQQIRSTTSVLSALLSNVSLWKNLCFTTDFMRYAQIAREHKTLFFLKFNLSHKLHLFNVRYNFCSVMCYTVLIWTRFYWL